NVTAYDGADKERYDRDQEYRCQCLGLEQAHRQSQILEPHSPIGHELRSSELAEIFIFAQQPGHPGRASVEHALDGARSARGVSLFLTRSSGGPSFEEDGGEDN